MLEFIEDNRLKIYLDNRVYRPQEDSFLMLDSIIEENQQELPLILEIGCGSGYIIVSLASMFPSKTMYATDINYHAIKLTLHNTKINNIDNIQLICCNFHTAFRKNGIPEVIIFNPPYLPKNPEIDYLLSNNEYYQTVGGEKGYEVASNLLTILHGKKSIVYLIISSLATNPKIFTQLHKKWIVKILNEKKMGFETIWTMKLKKKCQI